MRAVTDQEKELFLSGNPKSLSLTFEDGTVIESEKIYQESMSIEQTLSNEESLRYGKCSSNVFKVRIFATDKEYKGMRVTPTLEIGGYARVLGSFIVQSDNRTSDRKYKDIVAYDDVYYAGNMDVSYWYNYKVDFPITLKEFRDSLFDHIGLEQVETVLPMDDMEITKTIEGKGISGLSVLESICEANACFGTMNYDGKFEYVFFRDSENQQGYFDLELTLSDYSYGQLAYEDFTSKKITMVNIRETSDNEGYSYGNDGNTYTITGNFLLYDQKKKVLESVAKLYLEKAAITYTPASVRTRFRPWVELGDRVKAITQYGTFVYFPILHRSITGITADYEVLEAQGTEYCDDDINGLENTISKIRGTTSKEIEAAMFANNLVNYAYTNQSSYTVGSTPIQIIGIDIVTLKKTDILFFAEIKMNVEPSAKSVTKPVVVDGQEKQVTYSSEETPVVTMSYMWNDGEMEFHPTETYIRGVHTFPLIYFIRKIKENVTGTFKVFMGISGGTATINKGDIIATIVGQGLKASEFDWDGTIVIEDTVSPIPINTHKVNVAKLTETLNVSMQYPIPDAITEKAPSITINGKVTVTGLA